jgi:hypothetical protein
MRFTQFGAPPLHVAGAALLPRSCSTSWLTFAAIDAQSHVQGCHHEKCLVKASTTCVVGLSVAATGTHRPSVSSYVAMPIWLLLASSDGATPNSSVAPDVTDPPFKLRCIGFARLSHPAGVGGGDVVLTVIVLPRGGASVKTTCRLLPSFTTRVAAKVRVGDGSALPEHAVSG